MWRIFSILIVVAGTLLLMKAVIIGLFIAAMLPVVLIARFVVRPIIAPHLRTPLVDPLNGFKPIKK